MKKNAIVFVGGISGVGKTKLCRWLSQIVPTINHLTASSFLNNLDVVDQVSLAERIYEAALSAGKDTLVDGHLIVHGQGIPKEAAEKLRLTGIVVVTAPPTTILKQRGADATRIRPQMSRQQLFASQEKERLWARELSFQLEIPTVEVAAGSPEAFRRHVLDLLANV